MAEQLGCKIDIVSEDLSIAKLTKCGRQLMVHKSFIGDDDAATGVVAGDKALCARLLRPRGFPLPQQRSFEISAGEVGEVLEYARQHYPVVVKPVHGGRGGGVMINLRTDWQLEFAIRSLFRIPDFMPTAAGRRKFLVEEYVEGVEYRVLVCCGEVVDIVSKSRARVTGDGNSSILQLISAKNEQRRAISENFPLITNLAQIQRHLFTQELTLRSELAKGQTVMLDAGARIDTGGGFVCMELDPVAADNIWMFLDVASTLRLRFTGIDFIAEDLCKPWHQQRSAVIEVNTGMDMSMHVRTIPQSQGLKTPLRVLALMFEHCAQPGPNVDNVEEIC